MLDANEFIAACVDYAHGWKAADEVLYGLCRKHPRHDHYPTVMAKVAIIGRTYSAGLERLVKLKEGDNSDRLGKATAHIVRHAAELDGWIACLGPAHGVSLERLQEIVQIHGRFTALLRELTDPDKPSAPGSKDKRYGPRSFASKYLHFHCPGVPIYDSVASVALDALTKGSAPGGGKKPFKRPVEGDAEYHRYCCRFWLLWQDAEDLGVQPTVKQLDHFLWRSRLGVDGNAP